MRKLASVAAAAFLFAVPAVAAGEDSLDLQALAERYVALRLEADPGLAYFTGLPVSDHSRLPDRSPKGLARMQAEEDRLFADLALIDFDDLPAEEKPVYATMQEGLEASRGLRVCRQALWDVNHFAGWQMGFPHLARLQPVTTAAERKQALARWSALPAFVATEIENLRRGLDEGYSAPKPVVARVIRQLDGLLAMPREQSPFYAPALRAEDASFRAEYDKVYDTAVQPAIESYRDFLADEYLPRARESLALSALPEGKRCYAAMLRASTTLDHGPEKVFALGEETVARNRAEIVEIGRKLFGIDDVAEIVRRVNEAPDNRFRSADELLAYSKGRLARAIEKSRPLFTKLPETPVVIEVMPDHQAASGMSAHYIPGENRETPGKYIIPLSHWETDTRATADITLVHETVPGHHLQIALTFEQPQSSPVMRLVENAAFIEGWARYAEMLGEEAGIHDDDFARITRRIWPARGMVVDPGLHVFGWSREQAIDYLVDSGRFDEAQAEEMVDRIAALPGQLTSYDSGGLEIMNLRREAEMTLGKRFDLRAFHERVLERGVVPLLELRRHVRAWIAAEAKEGR